LVWGQPTLGRGGPVNTVARRRKSTRGTGEKFGGGGQIFSKGKNGVPVGRK